MLRNLGVDNAFIWADISSRAQETARILAQELGIRQVSPLGSSFDRALHATPEALRLTFRYRVSEI